jgi:FMN-dependent NADH-azoreductase
MPTILHLDSSARSFSSERAKRNSLSRMLADSFSTQWQHQLPHTKFIYRDLGLNPPDFISEPWIAATFTPEAQRTAEQDELLSLSDELIEEIAQADIILLSTPMYNYGMPATLKAWFDQVIRVNKTFTFDLGRGDFPLQATFSGKIMVLITSSGEFGFQPGGIRAAMNHLGPHINVASQHTLRKHCHPFFLP